MSETLYFVCFGRHSAVAAFNWTTTNTTTTYRQHTYMHTVTKHMPYEHFNSSKRWRRKRETKKKWINSKTVILALPLYNCSYILCMDWKTSIPFEEKRFQFKIQKNNNTFLRVGNFIFVYCLFAIWLFSECNTLVWSTHLMWWRNEETKKRGDDEKKSEVESKYWKSFTIDKTIWTIVVIWPNILKREGDKKNKLPVLFIWYLVYLTKPYLCVFWFFFLVHFWFKLNIDVQFCDNLVNVLCVDQFV